MKSIINELWHGNIIPQDDSRTNTKEMKELLGYMARHNEDLKILAATFCCLVEFFIKICYNISITGLQKALNT